MHEYAITKNIIDIVVQEATKNDCSRVLSVTIMIGDLSAVIDESVQMYFDIFSEGTIVKGAELKFERISALFYCPRCEQEFEKPRIGFECPQCLTTGKMTDKGKEFYVKEIICE